MLNHPSRFWSIRCRQAVNRLGWASVAAGSVISGVSLQALAQEQVRDNHQGKIILPASVLLSSDPILLADTALLSGDRPLLQFGSEGPEVQAVQAWLQLLGYYPGTIDGRYQEATVTAVSAFQEAAGLNRDGIVGPTTWAKLLPSVSQLDGSSTVAIPPAASNTSASSASDDASPSTSDSTDTVSGEDSSTISAGAETPDASDTAVAPPPSDGDVSSASATPATDIALPTLRQGMRGPAVVNLQERLSSLGLLQGSIDGIFGRQTEASVRAAQRYFDLEPDGIVGPATWRALLQ